MLWKLAVDLNGNLSTINISEDDPYITIQDKKQLKDDSILLISLFTKLCKFQNENKEKVTRLEVDCLRYERELNTYTRDPEKFFTEKFDIPPRDISSYSKKLVNNTKGIRHAYHTINDIREKFEDILRGLQSYEMIMGDKDEVRRIESVGFSAIRAKINKPTKIMYKYSPEAKLSNYDDHSDITSDDIHAEKVAMKVIDDFTTKGIAKKVLQSIVMPGKIWKGLGKSTPFPISGISGSGRKIETMQTMPTEGDVKVDTKNAKNAKTKSEAGFIVSGREIKPEHYLVDDMDRKYENSTTPMPMTTMPVYNQTFSKSEIIGVGEDIAKEESSKKEEMAKTIKPQEEIGAGIKHSKEFESLREEIRGLRKENESLFLRISQLAGVSSSNFPKISQSQVVKGSPGEEKEKQDIQIPATFQRHHTPLANWNLNFKKFITTSNEESITAMEVAIDLGYIITGLKNGNLAIFKFTNFEDITEKKILPLVDNLANNNNEENTEQTNKTKQTCILSLHYLNDGHTLYCGLSDGKLIKVDLNIFTFITYANVNLPIISIANPSNGECFYIAAGKEIFQISYEDKQGDNIINQFKAHDLNITDLIYIPQKDILCSGSLDKSVKVWNAKTKESLGVLEGHADIIKSLCYASNSNKHMILVSVSNDSYITFWNLTDKNLTKSLKMKSPAEKVIYLWDRKTVLTVHKSNNEDEMKGNFTLWNVETDEAKEFCNQGKCKKEGEGELSDDKEGKGLKSQSYIDACYFDDGRNIILATEPVSMEFWNAK